MRKCPSCGAEYGDDVSFCGIDGTITIEVQDPSDHDPRLGDLLGDYIIAARIEDGGMGRVYEGRHPETKARVAIKVLHERIALDSVAVERFKREFETAEEMDHENVVSVLDFGQTEDGSHYLTMEYLDGLELSRELEANGAFPPARLLRVMAQLAAGLDHAHSYGVIHRDLKPDNVFLCKSEAGDDVRLLDFGSVKLQMETGPKLTAIGTTLGSPYYMSPEQAMGKLDVDQRTDVFAVAAIAWELATGKIAFEGGSVAEILTKIVGEEPPSARKLNPELPPMFDDAILAGVSKDKTKRPASVGAFADSLFAAFGLGKAADWGSKSQAEIEAALATATPPEAGATPPAAATPANAPATPSTSDSGRETYVEPVAASGVSSGPSQGMIIGVAIAAVLLIVVALVLVFVL